VKVVSERLGRGHIALTIETYKHLPARHAGRRRPRLRAAREARSDEPGGTPEDVKPRYPPDSLAPVAP
jgi:hypothetical protein